MEADETRKITTQAVHALMTEYPAGWADPLTAKTRVDSWISRMEVRTREGQYVYSEATITEATKALLNGGDFGAQGPRWSHLKKALRGAGGGSTMDPETVKLLNAPAGPNERDTAVAWFWLGAFHAARADRGAAVPDRLDEWVALARDVGAQAGNLINVPCPTDDAVRLWREQGKPSLSGREVVEAMSGAGN